MYEYMTYIGPHITKYFMVLKRQCLSSYLEIRHSPRSCPPHACLAAPLLPPSPPFPPFLPFPAACWLCKPAERKTHAQQRWSCATCKHRPVMLCTPVNIE